MTKLITLEQIQEFKSITSNLNTVKQLDPYILEAQEFDIRPLLGDELYIALLEDYETSPSLGTTIYSDLYNGKTYTYGTRTYKHEGLVPVIAYYTYSRFLMYNQVTSTKYGMMQKTNDFSQPASDKLMSRLIQQAKSGAVMYQERVKLFLDHNDTDYPLWKSGAYRKKGGLRITPVGGNSNQRKYDKNNYCNNCNCLQDDCVCDLD